MKNYSLKYFLFTIIFLGGMLMATEINKENPKVTLTTNHGDIVIELSAKSTPVTVKNFLDYVQSGFYNKTIFHRVIAGFVIQGGGFTEGMVAKQTNPPIKNEASLQTPTNKRGTISMARTNDPHSATSQFFINLSDNNFLDFRSNTEFGYCAFGQVVSGMEVVDQIARQKTTTIGYYQDVPVETVEIISAQIN